MKKIVIFESFGLDPDPDLYPIGFESGSKISCRPDPKPDPKRKFRIRHTPYIDCIIAGHLKSNLLQVSGNRMASLEEVYGSRCLKSC